ncbi:MAG: hypothetical protein KF799_05805 [Bdellovibrionales bacterium]|nr:hypothetical protein [Bdellovibrionales bacterium]
MNSTELQTTSVSVNRAEQAVNNSIAKFESAMENLADKVEDTSQRIQHIVELSQRPVQELVQLKDHVQRAATPFINDIRANPRPWLMTAGLLAAGFFFFHYVKPGQRALETSRAV